VIANVRNITIDADAAVVHISSQQQNTYKETLQETEILFVRDWWFLTKMKW
jgi:hypothetical protein